MTQHKHDILIVGAGMVGMALALALAKKTNLSIALVEAGAGEVIWDKAAYHHRVSAIALSSVNLFKSLGVWEDICAKRVSPFRKIHVWDSADVEVGFDASTLSEKYLGYIIENNAIQAALLDVIRQTPSIHYYTSVALNRVQQATDSIVLLADDGRSFAAKLAVGADGARSWLRQAVGIHVTKHDYQQHAIVATVETTLSHDAIARQVFLSSGPLAFLPLAEPNKTSIVWSLPPDEAQAHMALGDAEFAQALSDAFANRLGEVVHVSKRFAFPLVQQQVSTYLAPRVALVGDAAHTIHPLAGQGVNMGFLDVISLVDVMTSALSTHRDFASRSNLRRYERWRKADNAIMMRGVNVIKQWFAVNHPTLKSLRTVGLNLTQEIHWMNALFARHAVGLRAR